MKLGLLIVSLAHGLRDFWTTLYIPLAAWHSKKLNICSSQNRQYQYRRGYFHKHLYDIQHLLLLVQQTIKYVTFVTST